MPDKKINRKIAVIFATDVVGYSKHMEVNESETILNLRECEAILTGLFSKYEGRLFNTGGDSFLAEFPSAVSAVECAVEFQNAIKERNSNDDPSVKLDFRIGINSGDVVIENENLLGDGVNIAARLEALSQTGGVTISKSVHDFVKGKTKFEFNDVGLQKVKQNEFHAFDILLEGSKKRKPQKSISKNKNLLVIASVAALCMIAASIFYENFFSRQTGEIEKSNIVSNKPIILVKPFSSSSEDDDLASQAITESLISSLSQYGGVRTLASSTSYAAKQKAYSDTDLMEKFGVNFVVSGSIQTFGTNSRLFAEVSDLKTNQALMSIKEDFKLDQIFDVQDKIGRSILEKLQVEAVEGTKALDTQNDFKTYEQYLLSINHDVEWRKWTKEGNSNAIKITEKLKELNVDKHVIESLTVWDIHQNILLGHSKNPEADKAIMLELSDKLVSNRGRDDDFLIRAIIELEHFETNCEYATDLLNRIADLSANTDNVITSGFIHSRCTNLEKAGESFRQALVLEPVDLGYQVTRMYSGILYALNEYELLKELLEPLLPDPELLGMPFWFYAAVLSEEGKEDEARNFYELGVTYGADEKWIMPMLNTQEASDRLRRNLSDYMKASN
jgi:TolB-like protein